MVSLVLWMWPACLLVRLFLGQLLAGVPARGQSSSDRTIYDNDCVMDARFYACASNSVDLLSQSVIPFQLSLDPPGSTCGTPDETYCTLGIVTECFTCDATDSTAHPPAYMYNHDINTWWQSVTWNKVYPDSLKITITFKFDHLYEMGDDIVITFGSSLPRSVTLESSRDFGETWQPLQYYRVKCGDDSETSNVPTEVPTAEPDTVICSEDYTSGDETPYKHGELRFPVRHDRYRPFMGETLSNYEELYKVFESTNLTQFLQFTDIRVRLLVPATDGKQSVGSPKPQDLIRYYYAIANVKINAGCFCHLHGQYCEQLDGRTVCECEHNTAGDMCEICKPLYNDRPWRSGSYLPFPDGEANPCSACQCNSHAPSCKYNDTKGYGVCEDCQDHTAGDHCESCLPGYYQNSTLLPEYLDHPDICLECGCEPLGVEENNTACTPTGQCFCSTDVRGRRCDVCRDQMYGLLLPEDPGQCKLCLCNTDGTVAGSRVCEQQAGQCPCKPNIGQRDCSQCRDGFYLFPIASPALDCLACGCDAGGSVSLTCDKEDGECTCRPQVIGKQCDKTPLGFYVPALDAIQLQPVETGSDCTMDTGLPTDQFPFTGRVFATCSQPHDEIQFENLDDQLMQPELIWDYQPVIRYSLNGTESWGEAALTFVSLGDSGVNLTRYQSVSQESLDPGCSSLSPQSLNINSIPAGLGQAWISNDTVFLDVRCRYTVILDLVSTGLSTSPILVDSVVLLPSLTHSQLYQTSENATKDQIRTCAQNTMALITTSASKDTCETFVFSLMAEMSGEALPCGCDPLGSVSTECETHGGQCTCKPLVTGRRCDQCETGAYNFTQSGCTACDCEELGSSSLVCDYETGQCPCQLNVGVAGQDTVLGLLNDLQCTSCLKDHHGFHTGQGCQPCSCDAQGGNKTQCNDFGECVCKPTITGEKCDRCQQGFYLFSQEGCTSCECDPSGSVGFDCGQSLGECACKANVNGLKCDSCAVDSFNLDSSNPDGCQPCFCYGHSTRCASAPGYVLSSVSSDSDGGWVQSQPLGLGRDYVTAPATFLGDKLGSYSQTFTYTLRSMGGPVIDLSGQPLVILQSQDQLIFYNTTLIVDGNYQQIDVQLHENYWYTNQVEQPTAFQMYSLLADLTGLHILASTGINLSLKNISMAISIPDTGEEEGTPARGVEDCVCLESRQVTGLSCEVCSQGHRRRSPIIGDPSLYERCDPCDCNGRGDTSPPLCDQWTGVCLNCRDGTQGDQCQECAPNVVVPSCLQCQDGFWGLAGDGCRACECQFPGSTSTMCDKLTGQCDCLPHVTGEKCDKCEDNFENLTVSGCTSCDSCYGLVQIEVDELRDYRDNLTQLVTQLTRDDVTADLGYFMPRLEATTAQLMQLMGFLAESDTVQESVQADIAILNTTLEEFKFKLNVDLVTALTQSNASLQATDRMLTNGQDLVSTVEETVETTEVTYLIFIRQFTDEIQLLRSSLKTLEIRLMDASGGALTEAQRLGRTVNNIENSASNARTVSSAALKEAQETQVVQQATSRAIDDLQIFMSRLVSESEQTSMDSESTADSATEVMQQAQTLKQRVNGLQSPDTSTVTRLSQLSAALREQAVRDAQKVQTERASDQTVVNQVAQAETDTKVLTDLTDRVEATSQTLEVRMRAAITRADQASESAEDTFSMAENKLAIMQEFDTRSTAAEREANKSLGTVQNVQQLSREAIEQAEALQASLAAIEPDAASARLTAEGAEFTAARNRQRIIPVMTEALVLKSESDSSLNDIDDKLLEVNEMNATVVTEARETCAGLEGPVSEAESLSSQALDAADASSLLASQTRLRINRVLAKMQTIGIVDEALIDELSQDVHQGREDFDQDQLSLVVGKLATAVADQRVRLDAMKARKDQMKLEIRRLKELQDQLRSVP